MVGESRLLDSATRKSLLHLRGLFDAFEKKKTCCTCWSAAAGPRASDIYRRSGLQGVRQLQRDHRPYNDGDRILGVLG